MWSTQTNSTVPLAAVKPLEGLVSYRSYCLHATHQALTHSRRPRERSPITGARLVPVGDIEGLPYARCPDTGSLFLAQLPEPARWAELLKDVNQYRHSPGAFHADLNQSRAEHVYAPKLEWIKETLRLQQLECPRVLEVVTPPSDFTGLMAEADWCTEVLTVDEMSLISSAPAGQQHKQVQAAVLLESLDRVDDPVALTKAIWDRLASGGLVFMTALVASGFDLAVLGLKSLYLYPPDRANCFTLRGLSMLLEQAGFHLLEVSTPGVLDVEIVTAHCARDPSVDLSPFERQLIESDQHTKDEFQAFLQQRGLSSFARMVMKKP